MSSTKYIHSSILIAVLTAIAGCSSEEKTVREFQHIDLKDTPILHYASVSSLTDPPTEFPEIWNREAMMKIGIKEITLLAKGGKNPEDTLAFLRFSYANNWKKLLFTSENREGSNPLRSNGMLTYSQSTTAEGTNRFSELFGVRKNTNTRIVKTDMGYMLLIAKRSNRFDTTWVNGSFLRPSAVISKIGNSIFSVDVYLPDGSSSKDIAQTFGKIPQLRNGFPTAQCSVVFTSNGRPVSSFQLNETFSQVAQLREWRYENERITGYTEWFGNTTVREIEFEYESSSQLPSSIIIDRNTYFCHYE